jgi:hypothetical protein
MVETTDLDEAGKFGSGVAYRKCQIRSGQATPVPIRHMTNKSIHALLRAKANSKTGQSVGKTIVLIEKDLTV